MSVRVGMGMTFRSNFELDAGEEGQRGGRICFNSHHYAGLALI